VADRLLATSPQDIGIPAIVIYELEYGIARSTSPKKRIKQLQEISALVNVLPFTEHEASLSAGIRVQLEKKGVPIDPHDVMIAGTALSAQGVLVTSNSKEFKRVPKLKIENWF